jgi:hypothetical protein
MTLSDRAPPPSAFLFHDFGAEHALFAYPAKASAETHEGDRIHARLYGIETRSPRTPYLCTWRNPNGAFAPGPPGEIFLAGAFGTEAWELPDGLVAQAATRQTRDECVVRIGWKLGDAGYRLTRFEFEVNPLSPECPFRSRHFGDELAELDLTEADMRFPIDRSDSLAFHLSGQLRQRKNRGESMEPPTVRLQLSGIAQPIPEWLMY